MGKSAYTVRIGSRAIQFGQPIVMGIVNVTPDSFSGDGLDQDIEKAVRRGSEMIASGAELVDVGGESTRPGAEAVSVKEELRRVVEVVERLSELHPGRVSVDTMKPDVADAALRAGASIVNDVSGLRNERMIRVVAEHEASVIIMHMLGDPRTMQEAPRYDDVVNEIGEYLGGKVAEAEDGGIARERIIVDPGIGFGKTVEHNIEIISRLGELRSIGRPIAIGVSRKSFIGTVTRTSPSERLGASIAAATIAAVNSADIIRAHDVKETVQALKMTWRFISMDANGS